MGYLRISASVLFEGHIDMSTGRPVFTSRMRNKIYDKEEGFREKLILKINESVPGKWHIHFNEYPSGNFDADVYVEKSKDFLIIRSILTQEFDESPLESIWEKAFKIELFGNG